MLKSKNFRFWFCIFAIQIFTACLVPTAVLLSLPSDEMQVYLEVTGLSISGAGITETKDILDRHFREIVEKGELVFESEGKQVKIPYTDFELQIDARSILEKIEKGRYKNRYFQLIGKTTGYEGEFIPEVYYNEAKLKSIVMKMEDFFYQQPINAAIMLSDGNIYVSEHQSGLKLDTAKTLDYIKENITTDPLKEIIISEDTAPDLFNVTEPKYTTDELAGFTQIYAEERGELPAGTAENYKNVIALTDCYIIGSGRTTSFKENMPLFSELKGLDTILASALYKAILPFEDIKVVWRKPSNQPISGIEAGFEVNLEDDGDLKFLNDSANEIAIIFQTNDNNEWIIAIAGKPGLNAGEIITEKTKIAPPVIYSQDNTLPEKEQRVVEPGKDGLSVKVYRVLNGESVMLYEDVYPPVERVIAIGSGVKKVDIIK
ncbi:MAG: hypothetical protein GX211_07930 [Clostridiaceae bacterium]|nr:hypothetical protein [Clostridiaceae bacterium]